MEHWGDHNRQWVSQIDTNLRDDIYALKIHEESETLFVGGKDKILKQFNLRDGTLVKDYYLGVGWVRSLSSFKRLLCVGGNNSHFALLDMEQSKVLTEKPFGTSVMSVLSSQFLTRKVRKQVKIGLAISGGKLIFFWRRNEYYIRYRMLYIMILTLEIAVYGIIFL